MRAQLLVTIYTLLIFAVLVVLLGIPGLSSSTEARELEVIKTIFHTGEWLLPLRNGLIPSKPPLFHWIGAAFAEIAGTHSVLSGRLVSAIFGCMTVLLCAFATRRIFSGRCADAYCVAVSAMLTLCFAFSALMTEARVDMIGCFFIVAALCALLKDFRADQAHSYIPGAWALNFFWIFCALGFLARGPLNILFPLLIAGCCLTYLNGIKSAALTLLRPRLGWLCVIGALSWYGVAFLRAGDIFLQKQLIFENLQRFTGGERINTKPFWFYLPAFLRMAFPWSVLFLGYCWCWLRSSGKASRFDPAHQARGVFVIWFWVGLLFFSVASGKRPSYILPILPAMAIFLGVSLVDHFYRSGDLWQQRVWRFSQRFSVWPLVLCFVLLLELLRFPFVSTIPEIVELRYYLSSSATRFQLTLLFSALFLSLIGGAALRRRLGNAACAVAILVLSVLIFGQACKARLQAYDLTALQIASSVSRQQIFVLKPAWDESFDVLTYYNPKKVIYRDLEISQLGCGVGQQLCGEPLLVGEDWFYQYVEQSRKKATKIALKGSFANWRAGISKHDRKQFVLFSIEPS